MNFVIIGEMGSIKNKRNHRNNHRWSMQKRWHASKYKKAKNVRPTEQLSCDQCKGSRIINLDQLQKCIGELTTHAVKCSSQIILNGEKRAGLASVLSS